MTARICPSERVPRAVCVSDGAKESTNESTKEYTHERGSVPTPSLSSRQARWGAVLLALGALLILGNLVVCLTRAWAFSGLAIPAVVFVGAGVVMLELSPEAGVRPWWEEPGIGDTSSVETAGEGDPSGVAA